jgi:Ribonuclease G/E
LVRDLLIAAGPGEWRAALIEGGVPVELYVERGDRREAGSVHLGRVVRLVPALGAALVDIGGDRPAFLPQREIVPRGKRLYEGERLVVQIRREAQGGKAPTLTLPRKQGRESPLPRENGGGLGWGPFAAALATGLPGALNHIRIDEPGAVLELRAAFPDTTVEHVPEAEWPVDLDDLFAEALAETVALPGGGTAHFEPTRAGVMIDIDSGTPEGGSPERTGLTANLAAAALIARHIRLRNLGGGIIIDFVGLDRRSARERVRVTFAHALAADPAKPQLLGWTRLGHFELVRPRRRRSLAEALLEPRAGGPLVKTALTVAHEALRALRREARAQPGRQWRLTASAEVASALAGAAASAVRTAEERFARKLVIEAGAGYGREQFQISPR